MIGEVLGNYRLIDSLGRGGMGEVFLAEHSLVGRKAAIKVLLPELSCHRNIVARFFTEAKATSCIKHPGIVEMYDFGYHDNGVAYIVMEYLKGESLETRLRTHRVLTLESAVRLTRQILGALAAAHDSGIVHRDLKPDNIFIVPDPEVSGGERIKLLDFGIAKLSDGDTSGTMKTRTGMVMGTPSYMAPEQCKGSGNIDYRADLYSVGCIFFRMLCGRPPFVAAGSGEIMALQIFAPPPDLRLFVPSVPSKIGSLSLELLQKEPMGRPPNARVAIARLESWVGTGHDEPRSTPRSAGRSVIGETGSNTTLGAVALMLAPKTGHHPSRRSYWRTLVALVSVLSAGAVSYGWLLQPTAVPDLLSARTSPVRPDSPNPDTVDKSHIVQQISEDTEKQEASAREETPAQEETPAGTVADTDIDNIDEDEPLRMLSYEIHSIPSGARVIAHGNVIGTTPHVLAVEPGEQFLLQIVLRDFRPISMQLPADADSERKMVARLTAHSAKKSVKPSKRRQSESRQSKPKPKPKPRLKGTPRELDTALENGGSIDF